VPFPNPQANMAQASLADRWLPFGGRAELIPPAPSSGALRGASSVISCPGHFAISWIEEVSNCVEEGHGLADGGQSRQFDLDARQSAHIVEDVATGWHSKHSWESKG